MLAIYKLCVIIASVIFKNEFNFIVSLSRVVEGQGPVTPGNRLYVRC